MEGAVETCCFCKKISARNAAVAVKSAKSAYAESCDKKEGKIKSPKIKKIFSLKISRPEKNVLSRLKV